MIHATVFIYKGYGLTFASDIALPGLQKAPQGDADVVISRGAINPSADGDFGFRNWTARPDHVLLELIPDTWVLIENGNSITYELSDGCDDDLLVSTIMGTGLAALILQRKLLPMHSCCVKTEMGALLVMGRSGAGKSTFLTGLLEHGFPMMADDVTAVSIDEDGKPIAIPAFPAARLWQDACELASVDVSPLEKVRTDMNKYYVPVDNFHGSPARICGIVWLIATNQSEATISAVEPVDTIRPLRRFIYRKNFLQALDLDANAFTIVSALAGQVPMVKVERPGAQLAPSVLVKRAVEALQL